MNKNKKRSNKRSGPKGKDQFTKKERKIESEDMKPSRDFKSDNDVRGGDCRKYDNDWRWYAVNPQLVADYASFPYATPVGTKPNTGLTSIDLGSIPGVMAIYYEPSIGQAEDETSPINVAMRQFFAEVRKRNSGRVNYDAPDLMMYNIAVGECYAYLSFLKRVYGTLRNYTLFNRYYAKSVVSAMGVNYDNATANMYQLKGYIDILAAKLSALAIPNGISYMARHVWMNENIYTDSMTPKAQTYMYVPRSFYTFQLTGNEGAQVGSLQLKVLNNLPIVTETLDNTKTIQQLIDFGDSMLNPLLEDQDFNIMSGDIMKAFGPSGIVVPAGISADYQVIPVYNQEVLSQIENATVWNGVANTFVTQNTSIGGGYLQSPCSVTLTIDLSEPVAELDSSVQVTLGDVFHSNHMLNFHHVSPTPEEVLVATRLTNRSTGAYPNVQLVNEGRSLYITFNLEGASSEIVTGAYMYYFVGMTNRTLTSVPISSFQLSINYQAYTVTTQYNTLMLPIILWEQFDWAPAVMPIPLFQWNASSVSKLRAAYPAGLMIDSDYYTYITPVNLREMSQVALLSEFTVPQSNYQG